MEEAQGGAAVGAAKEAVTTSAKARGGTNGWGGNMTSCWSCWQRVLLMLVVWLVVPAEAAGAAHAAAGVTAAAAAAAVGANAVLNFLWPLRASSSSCVEYKMPLK